MQWKLYTSRGICSTCPMHLCDVKYWTLDCTLGAAAGATAAAGAGQL